MNKSQKAAKACCRLIAGTGYIPDVIIDFGIGLAEEVLFFKLHWPNVKLIGADPICRYNFGMFDKVYPAAICDSMEPTVKFYEWVNTPCSSGFIPNKRRRKNAEHIVPVMSLDTIYQNDCMQYQHIILWIDCEGAELSAMRSGPKMLAAADWIHLEVTPESKREHYPGIPYLNEVHEFLTEHHFVLVQETGNVYVRHDRTYCSSSSSSSSATDFSVTPDDNE